MVSSKKVGVPLDVAVALQNAKVVSEKFALALFTGDVFGKWTRFIFTCLKYAANEYYTIYHASPRKPTLTF